MADDEIQSGPSPAQAPSEQSAAGISIFRRPARTRNWLLSIGFGLGALFLVSVAISRMAPWGLVSSKEQSYGGKDISEGGGYSGPNFTPRPAGMSDDDWTKERKRQLEDDERRFQLHMQDEEHKQQDYERRQAIVDNWQKLLLFLDVALVPGALIFATLGVRRYVRNPTALIAFWLAALALLPFVTCLAAPWGLVKANEQLKPSRPNMSPDEWDRDAKRQAEDYKRRTALISTATQLCTLAAVALGATALIFGIAGVLYHKRHPSAGGLGYAIFAIVIGIPFSLLGIAVICLMTGAVRIPVAGWK
jgi:hypothetical protein